MTSISSNNATKELLKGIGGGKFPGGGQPPAISKSKLTEGLTNVFGGGKDGEKKQMI